MHIEIDATTAFVVISAAVVLVLQLVLCYKAKKLLPKLIPVLFLVLSTILFSVLSAIINGWDGLGLLFFALLAFGLLFVSGIGWAIWAIAGKRNK